MGSSNIHNHNGKDGVCNRSHFLGGTVHYVDQIFGPKSLTGEFYSQILMTNTSEGSQQKEVGKDQHSVAISVDCYFQVIWVADGSQQYPFGATPAANSLCSISELHIHRTLTAQVDLDSETHTLATTPGGSGEALDSDLKAGYQAVSSEDGKRSVNIQFSAIGDVTTSAISFTGITVGGNLSAYPPDFGINFSGTWSPQMTDSKVQATMTFGLGVDRKAIHLRTVQ